MRASLLSLCFVLIIGAGCDVPKVVVVADPADSDVLEAGDVPEDVPSGPLSCIPGDAEKACPPDLFCEAGARICVACLYDVSRCSEDGGLEVCLRPDPIAVGEVEGGTFEPEACPPNQVCVPDGENAACEPVVCEPGLIVCENPVLSRTCNVYGTGWHDTPCEASKACYDGACEPVRSNVLILFDTSGSMHEFIASVGSALSCDPAAGDCLDAYPQCDDPSQPLTRFTLAKSVFSENLQAPGGVAQYALQRFPQKESAGKEGNCFSGWYGAKTTLTGDEDLHATEPGGFFDLHRPEALLVPFPARSSLDNKNALLSWMDFDEAISQTEAPCDIDGTCADGSCRVVDNQYLCYQHTQPELRAEGPTPLGKSLFYAGEYFRRSVLVDGKPCEVADDCASVGYTCNDGVCRDPYRDCKNNVILVFTDGNETEHTSTSDFFNPIVQAKRLAYGLGCEADTDCRAGALCDDGICWTEGMDEALIPPIFDGLGYDNISRPDGTEASVRTTVVTLEPSSAEGTLSQNARIALAGGGLSVDVYAADPLSLKEAIYEQMTPPLKCEPEEF
jgi:hypothetical protein